MEDNPHQPVRGSPPVNAPEAEIPPYLDRFMNRFMSEMAVATADISKRIDKLEKKERRKTGMPPASSNEDDSIASNSSASFDVLDAIAEPENEELEYVRNKKTDSDEDLLMESALFTSRIDPRQKKELERRSSLKLKEEHRRKSMAVLKKKVAEQEALLKARNYVTPTVFKPQEPYAHIKLDKLSVRSIFNFFEDIRNYEAKSGQAFPDCTQVASDVRRKLVAHLDWIKDDQAFYDMGRAGLQMAIKETMRPTTTADFAKKLRNSLLFDLRPGFMLDLYSYRIFHVALKGYITRFKEAVVFLAENNEDNVPSVDGKENGLLRIFKEGIPCNFAENVLSAHRIVSVSTLPTFFNKFKKIMDKLYDLSVEVNSVSVYFSPGVRSNTQRREVLPAKTPFKRFTPKSSTSQLQAMDLEDFDDDEVVLPPVSVSSVVSVPAADNVDESSPDELGDVTRVSPVQEVRFEDVYDDPVSPVTLSASDSLNFIPGNQPRGNSSGGRVYDPYRKPMAGQVPQRPIAATPNGASPATPSVCVRMMNKGECGNPNCTYSHDPEYIEKELARMLRDKPWKGQKTPGRPPPEVPRRT